MYIPAELTKEETTEHSRSKKLTLNEEKGRGHNVKYLPYVFTESGIAMLSAVLRSDVVVEVSIRIMDSFVEMRRFIAGNA